MDSTWFLVLLFEVWKKLLQIVQVYFPVRGSFPTYSSSCSGPVNVTPTQRNIKLFPNKQNNMNDKLLPSNAIYIYILYISTDHDGIKEQLRSKHTFILGFHIFRHDISMFLRSMSVELHAGVKCRRAMITGINKRCRKVFSFHVISCVAFPLVGEIGANFARIFASEGIPRNIFHQLLRICQCVT